VELPILKKILKYPFNSNLPFRVCEAMPALKLRQTGNLHFHDVRGGIAPEYSGFAMSITISKASFK
jgi:hypothetical protein